MDEDCSFSLRENVKQKFLKMLRDIVNENSEEGKQNNKDKESEKKQDKSYLQKKEYVLILDSESGNLISNILTVPDIVSVGINYLQSLEKIRKCFPSYIGIYVINPCKNSIDLLINDFHRGYVKQNVDTLQLDLANDDDNQELMKEKKNVKPEDLQKQQKSTRQYGKIHIRFIATVPDKYIKKIAKKKELFKRILSCKEINHNFEVYDKFVFRLNTRSYFTTQYGVFGSNYQTEQRDNLTGQLTTILTAIGQINTIKILWQQNNIYLQDFGNVIKTKITNLIKLLDVNKNSNEDIINQNAEDCYFLIMDRSQDLIAPLMHDFQYMSFLQDVLDIKNDQIMIEINNPEPEKKPEIKKTSSTAQKLKKLSSKDSQENEENEEEEQKQKAAVKQKKEYLLKLNDMDDDTVYQQYKFQHFNFVAQNIDNDLKRFLKSNEVMAKDKHKLSEDDIQEVVQKMPIFRLLIINYNIHMQIIGQLIEQIAQKEIIALAELEQSLATRVQNNSYQTKTSYFLPEIYQFLQKPNVLDSDKLRLVILVFLLTDFSQKDFATFQQMINKHASSLEKDLKLIMDVLRGIEKDQNKFSLKKRSTSRVQTRVTEAAKLYQSKATLPVSRYTPELSYVCNGIIQQIIQKKQKIIVPGYEFTQCTVNGKKNEEENQNQIQEENNLNEIRSRRKSDNQIIFQEKDYEFGKEPKFVIFMVGGISYLEIAHLMRLQDKYKGKIMLIIGSNQTIDAKDYIANLLSISDERQNNSKNNEIFKSLQQENQNQDQQQQDEDDKNSIGDDDQEYNKQDIYEQQKDFDQKSKNKEEEQKKQIEDEQKQEKQKKQQQSIQDTKEKKPQNKKEIQQKNIAELQNKSDQQKNKPEQQKGKQEQQSKNKQQQSQKNKQELQQEEQQKSQKIKQKSNKNNQNQNDKNEDDDF